MLVVIPGFSQICHSSVITARRLRKKWNLLSTRQQKHTMESIYDEVCEICKCFPLHGVEAIKYHMVYVPHGECNHLMLFLFLLIVVQGTYQTSPEHSGT